MQADWTRPDALLARGPFPLVLAADVLYDHGSLVALADLLPQLVRGAGEVWIADQDRPPAREFLDACRQWATVSTIDTAHPEVRVHRLRRRDC